MLRSIKQLYGDKLSAVDGEIGHVKDFYFDDQNWAIRYLVVDTGTWLTGRQVLISPHSRDGLAASGKLVRANLTRQQIQNSPTIEAHKPVSRQFEEEYFRYYNWQGYWQGDGLWGVSAFPIMEPPPESSVTTSAGGTLETGEDAHLRSAKAVTGYLLKRGEETVGHVSDFMIDAESWAIGQFAVKTGHRFSGKEILIATKLVQRMSYEESIVYLYPTEDAADQSTPQPVATAAPV